MKRFEDIWKNEASKMQVEPSDKVWTNIQQEMNVKELRTAVGLRSWMGIAASVAMLLLSSLFVYQQISTKGKNQALVVEDLRVKAPIGEDCFESRHVLDQSYRSLVKPISDGYGELNATVVLN